MFIRNLHTATKPKYFKLLVTLFIFAFIAGGTFSLAGTSTQAASEATSPLSLDETGQTIPDTNYSIPAGSIYMSPTGSDTNAGGLNSPVKTINKAISLIAAGVQL